MDKCGKMLILQGIKAKHKTFPAGTKLNKLVDTNQKTLIECQRS